MRERLIERGLTSAAAYIQARPPGAVIPLSSTQRRMWFAQALFPDDASHNMVVGLRIDGPLALDSLRAALIGLFDRHSVLRARYRRGLDGEPVQVLEPTGDVALPVIDIGGDAAMELGVAVESLTDEIARRPFDLASEPALRIGLARATAEVHVLILVLHHIAADEITWNLLFSDLSSRYGYETGSADAVAAPPALEYADYAVWEQQRLRRGDLDHQLAYWLDRLTPVPEAVGFPNISRPAVRPGPAGGHCRHALPESTTAGLLALGRAHQASLFVIVLAGLATVLHRYTDATDLVIGVPALLRDRPEIEAVGGNFTNTLALRIAIDGRSTFLDVLERTRSACHGALDNRDVPFELIIERVAPRRATGRSPLFEVMFAATRSVTRGLTLADVMTTDLGLRNETSMFDLAVDLVDDCMLAATFRTAKYTPEFIQQVLEHLASVLAHGVTDPTQRVSALPLLTGPQRRRIVHEWNATTDPRYPGDDPVHTLFERYVCRDPGAIAVVSETGRLSYLELDDRATALAAVLCSVGVGAESLVGISMVRSADQVAAVLAVLKAGAAFVPLDPAWPARRIAEVCTAARLAAVLSHGDSAERLLDLAVPVLNLDEKLCGASTLGKYAPMVRMADLAYVEFTSGSTGAPKGVMVTHAGICNRLLWQADLLEFAAGSAALHKSPLGFDMGINELLLPLVRGGRVILARPGAEADPAYLLDQIARHGVTFIDLVPSLLDPILDRPEFIAATRSLTSVWTGGEALSPELLERFRTHCAIPMYHGYGPTEATVACTHEIYRPGTHRHGVTIGTPNTNNQLYILDERLCPVSPGVPGELYVGGVQLARGYLGQPARTADRFVADAVSGEPGARIYRTGDRARFRADGTIEFLGRVDNELKIRGRRIAPEEVESALVAHPVVRRAVVLGRDDRLVAYCACDEPVPTWPQLRDWLRLRLPEQLVPEAGVILDALPQLSSGKVDRVAVQRIPVESTVAIVPYLAPRYAMERALAELWLGVLDVPRVGVDDNFFDLGGHSLLLARIQNLLSEQLGCEVSLLDLYEHPTVAQLAAHLRGAGDQTTDSGATGSGLVAARARAQRGRGARAQRLSQQGQGR
ncbi:non-ribosomal peptide synthetase [Nocardia brasiliensis]